MLDAQRVRTQLLLRSASHTESQALLAAELVDHRLSWGAGTVDTRFSRVRLKHLSLAVLQYGAAVEVRPEPLRDFVLVQMPLRGRAELSGRHGRLALSAQTAAVVSPNHAVRLHWEADCEQLLIKLPLAALRGIARSTLNLPDRLLRSERFEFAPALSLSSDAGRAWLGQLSALLHSVPLPGAAAFDARWRCHLEESLMLLLLTQQPSALTPGWAATRPSADHADAAPGESGQPGAAAEHPEWAGTPLDRLQHYIADHLGAPVSLADLADAAGLGTRSLHALCRQHQLPPPMTMLRQARLDAARRQLQRGGQSVTAVALAHGFDHLGRFSAQYRQRFDELPSCTGH